jgi:phosphate transport system substrate-binding protein
MKHFRRLIGLTATLLVLLTVFAPNAAIPSYANNAAQGTEQPTAQATTQPTAETTIQPTIPATAQPTIQATAQSTPQSTAQATAQGTAQAVNTVTVDGSNIVSPILKAASQAYSAKHPETKVDVSVSGTSGGFEKLCAGSLDINMAVRAITDAEAGSCQEKKVNFVELLLGYDALTVIVNNSSKATCLTPDQLNKLLSPSATGLKSWLSIDPAVGDVPISAVYAPAPESQVYVLADSIIAGDKLRTDIQTVETPAKVAEKINAEVNAIGIMTLSDYNSAKAAPNAAVRALQLKGGVTCVDPTVPSLEEARYPAAESLYLYVNAASLDRQPVADFLNYLLSSEGRAPVTNTGFVAASGTTYDRGLSYLKNKQTGRTFSRIQNVSVPPDQTGAISTDGSPAVFPIFKAVGDAFSPRYANIKVNPSAYGNEAGYRNLCASTVDMIGATRLPTDAEAAACQKNNIQTLRLQIGATGVVIVVNGNNKFAQCLTTDEIAKLFNSDSEGKVKKWSDVNPSFPATDLLILTPTDGAPETDLLLSKAVKAVAPVRRKDVTENSDALYRGAATQNVEGAVTYMTFAEFQTVKTNVHAVAVNAGSGCVDPTEANLKNSTYPLSQMLYVVLNVNVFVRPDIKAFVWFLLSDDTIAILGKQGLVGTDVAGFVAARDVALERFAQATAPGTPQAGATGAATSAATSQAGATEAATPGATTAATAPAAATAAPTAASTAQ